jgi:hypothetical protein
VRDLELSASADTSAVRVEALKTARNEYATMLGKTVAEADKERVARLRKLTREADREMFAYTVAIEAAGAAGEKAVDPR